MGAEIGVFTTIGLKPTSNISIIGERENLRFSGSSPDRRQGASQSAGRTSCRAKRSLENEMQCQLYLPGIDPRRSDSSGAALSQSVAAIECQLRITEVRPVEKIEQLAAKLQVGTLPEEWKTRFFHKGNVRIGYARRNQNVAPDVAQERSGTRNLAAGQKVRGARAGHDIESDIQSAIGQR